MRELNGFKNFTNSEYCDYMAQLYREIIGQEYMIEIAWEYSL